MTRYLETADVLRIHEGREEFFAGDGDPIVPAGVRDANLLHSACGRPRTAFGDQEKYEAVAAKAAALFHSLVMNHPFHNGNKRTALVAAVVFLGHNGRTLVASDDELFVLVVDVATGRLPISKGSGSSDAFVEETERLIVERTKSQTGSLGERDIPVRLTAVLRRLAHA